MDNTHKLPVGVEGFEKIRTENFYYVDKTGLIADLLKSWGEVNLFTRPRRFGKSLNMNMLRYFFEYGCDGALFRGLDISRETELCEKYMGKFPVISITLKEVTGSTFEDASAMLRSVIGREALRFQFLSESSRLTDREKVQYHQLLYMGGAEESEFVMSGQVLEGSLYTLSCLLHKHYGQKVILLIDEYDVPLDKAEHFQYSDKMIHLFRSLLGQALKSNSSLYFAVLTGCLRIAKESIFTGLNNFKTLSLTNVRFSQYFGFSDREVRDMLSFYGLEEKYDLIKEWYDGYRFGNTHVYCPWDVINYVDLLLSEPEAAPQAFWINTSGNDIIRTFLRKASRQTREELELLINGTSILKKINQELTYRDLYSDKDNLWSVLFITGYLTYEKKMEDDQYLLSIPNLEIRKIFIEQIQEWFREETGRDSRKLDLLCQAFVLGDAPFIEKQLNIWLRKTISIRDTAVRDSQKENFFHGILLGLLSHREDWDILSNAESGDGFSDILVELEEESIGLVIEIKYSDSGSLQSGCEEAFRQIEDKRYDARLIDDGMETILRYAVSCKKKKCMVQVKKS